MELVGAGQGERVDSQNEGCIVQAEFEMKGRIENEGLLVRSG